MERKLTDALTAMIDAGLITPLDSLKIRYEERTEQFSYHPSREDIDLLQEKVFSEVLRFTVIQTSLDYQYITRLLFLKRLLKRRAKLKMIR